jgi:hypothetical protein
MLCREGESRNDQPSFLEASARLLQLPLDSGASRYHCDFNDSDTPTSALTFNDNITFRAAKTAAVLLDH